MVRLADYRDADSNPWDHFLGITGGEWPAWRRAVISNKLLLSEAEGRSVANPVALSLVERRFSPMGHIVSFRYLLNFIMLMSNF